MRQAETISKRGSSGNGRARISGSGELPTCERADQNKKQQNSKDGEHGQSEWQMRMGMEMKMAMTSKTSAGAKLKLKPMLKGVRRARVCVCVRVCGRERKPRALRRPPPSEISFHTAHPKWGEANCGRTLAYWPICHLPVLIVFRNPFQVLPSKEVRKSKLKFAKESNFEATILIIREYVYGCVRGAIIPTSTEFEFEWINKYCMKDRKK